MKIFKHKKNTILNDCWDETNEPRYLAGMKQNLDKRLILVKTNKQTERNEEERKKTSNKIFKVILFVLVILATKDLNKDKI